MLVYHGSNVEVSVPRIITGRNTKDFGTGFYCTVIREQAERWAKRYKTPVVNIYSILIDNDDLDILEFKEMTDQWLDFIIDCRSGKPHNHPSVVVKSLGKDEIMTIPVRYMRPILTDVFRNNNYYKQP
ncbi:MAG: DUF3990 domain-containing protein [Oscillospiraceae bacterium]|nr:DUF3990 domain-containing protein [Oscillospiraceae bacterium]